MLDGELRPALKCFTEFLEKIETVGLRASNGANLFKGFVLFGSVRRERALVRVADFGQPQIVDAGNAVEILRGEEVISHLYDGVHRVLHVGDDDVSILTDGVLKQLRINQFNRHACLSVCDEVERVTQHFLVRERPVTSAEENIVSYQRSRNIGRGPREADESCLTSTIWRVQRGAYNSSSSNLRCDIGLNSKNVLITRREPVGLRTMVIEAAVPDFRTVQTEDAAQGWSKLAVLGDLTKRNGSVALAFPTECGSEVVPISEKLLNFSDGSVLCILIAVVQRAILAPKRAVLVDCLNVDSLLLRHQHIAKVDIACFHVIQREANGGARGLPVWGVKDYAVFINDVIIINAGALAPEELDLLVFVDDGRIAHPNGLTCWDSANCALRHFLVNEVINKTVVVHDSGAEWASERVRKEVFYVLLLDKVTVLSINAPVASVKDVITQITDSTHVVFQFDIHLDFVAGFCQLVDVLVCAGVSEGVFGRVLLNILDYQIIPFTVIQHLYFTLIHQQTGKRVHFVGVVYLIIVPIEHLKGKRMRPIQFTNEFRVEGAHRCVHCIRPNRHQRDFTVSMIQNCVVTICEIEVGYFLSPIIIANNVNAVVAPKTNLIRLFSNTHLTPSF